MSDVAGATRPSVFRHRARVGLYVAIAVALTIWVPSVWASSWRSTHNLHTLAETVAAVMALTVAALAMIRFRAGRSSLFLFIGTGFGGTALIDAYHVIATTQWLGIWFPSELQTLTPWTWLTSRFFLSAMMVAAWLAWRHERLTGSRSWVDERKVALVTAAFLVVNFVVFAVSPLRPVYSEAFLGRPAELVPAALFAVALGGFMTHASERREVWMHWLVVSLLLATLGQTLYMPFSHELFDASFDVAHLLKLLGYGALLVGLFASAQDAFTVLEEGAERRFRGIVESVADGIVQVGPDGTIRLINEAALKLFGYDRSDLLGRPVEMLVPQSAWSRHESHRATYVAAPHVREMGVGLELSGRRRDGTEVPVEIKLSPQGEPAGSVVAVVRDVSDRRAAAKALRESEERYRSLVEGTPYAMFRTTSDCRPLDGNPAFFGMLGLESDRELDAGHFGGICADPAEHEQMLLLCERGESVEGAELRWKRIDGGVIKVRISGRPVRNGSPMVLFYEWVAEDITERETLERQLRQAQKMEAVGQLAGGVAHNFNNLLTVVIGESEVAMLELPEDHPARDSLQQILGAGARGAALTNQLLAFSRKHVEEPVSLNLSDVVGKLDRMLRRLLPERIEVTLALAGDLWSVVADRGNLEQVLVNLVVNARDAMPEAGRLTVETRNVTLSKHEASLHSGAIAGDYVLLAVSDTGVGMSEEVAERIFEPFFTTKEVGAGTGLGLATSFGIVSRSGGFCSVKSAPGKGTRMEVFIPSARSSDAPQESATAAELSRGSGSVMIVEDEPGVRSVAARVLRRLGYSVIEVGSGNDALRELATRGGGLHLLLTDVVMPGMTGVELATAVRALYPETRILFMSGYPTGAERELRVNVESVLPKPFTAASLAQAVRTALDS